MKYKPGQKVKIRRYNLEYSMESAAKGLNPSHVATIDCIVPDPHSGEYMYQFEECSFGWYESEVEGLYYDDVGIENRFEILDL